GDLGDAWRQRGEVASARYQEKVARKARTRQRKHADAGHVRDALQETERRGDSDPHARRNHGDQTVRRIELKCSRRAQAEPVEVALDLRADIRALTMSHEAGSTWYLLEIQPSELRFQIARNHQQVRLPVE